MATQTPAPQSATSKRPGKMTASQSLNHLLNFTLPPRQTHQFQSLPRRKRTTNQQVWNKERFVNAQYRFVMNPSGDYTVHFADPDIYFQWHDILQVILPRASAVASASSGEHHHIEAEGVTTCPICLSPPTAPRMTKCGHIFCYPCILHYLSTSDNPKWVRCPICFDSVNERQLKSVKWYDGPSSVEEEDDSPPRASSSSASLDSGMIATPRLGSTVRMRLMQRPQITTLALPRSQTWPSDLMAPHQAPFYFLPDVYTFAKFMLATPSYLVTDLTKDLDDLAVERRMLASMKDDLGVSFVDAADAKVRHQIDKAHALEMPLLKEAIDNAMHLQQQITNRVIYNRRKKEQVETAPLEDAPEAFLAIQKSGFNTPAQQPSPAPTPAPPVQVQVQQPPASRNPRQRRNLNPPPPSTSTYYYYQAATGMPIFLHPLDIKILLSHFNNYASFPDTITVRVESYAESTVNEDLRKRCKYLAHLPEGADVVFVETDLEGVVGPEGLKNFEKALSMRSARRKEKGRKDDRAKARAEEREKEKLVTTWNEVTRSHPDAYIPPPIPREPSPLLDEFPEPGHESTSDAIQTQTQQQQGVWGQRSFAATATAASGRSLGQRPPQGTRRTQDRYEDEYDWDVAFHELEQRGAGGGGRNGGGKKRTKGLVVLGGGGGRRR
ncbi:hypothetical protein QCA50_010336 [Cerrena zonata]|uniref:RING-type domain-containing protein n=1 Tax=Cerrena zonata TaxID=2478898 RepID=A0AAW0G0H6_9APHY